MGFFHRFVYLLSGRRPLRRETGGAAQVDASAGPRSTFNWAEILSSTRPALCVATAYRCIRILSESVAQLPMTYSKRRGEVFVQDADSSLNYLLTVQPDYWCSAFDFWRRAMRNISVDGNAYIVPFYDIDRSTGQVEYKRLALCSPNAVSHHTDTDTYDIHDSVVGVDGVFDENEVIHLKGYPSATDPKVGVSVLEHARQTINIASAGDGEAYSNFTTGGRVRGIVCNDRSVQGFGEYQDNQLDKAAEDLSERFEQQRITYLPGMADFKQISLSSVDMQFLESRKFTVREICRFFGVHPSLVFDDTSNNYKSAEMANAAFLSNTLNPILCMIEGELLRKLVPANKAAKRRFRFDRRALLVCDLQNKVAYQKAALEAGLFSVNELRVMENLPPVPNGDIPLVSANLKPLGAETPPAGEATE